MKLWLLGLENVPVLATRGASEGGHRGGGCLAAWLAYQRLCTSRLPLMRATLMAWATIMAIFTGGAAGEGAAAQEMPSGEGQVTATIVPSARDTNAPRLMGMNIGQKHYDDPTYQAQLARLDLVILGFYRGWSGVSQRSNVGDTVRALKRLNPSLLVGQYTVLNESGDDPKDLAQKDVADKITAERWWLRNAGGERVQWTSAYSAWEVNFTAYARPDVNGRRYPEWRAWRDYQVFFGPVPEFDVWYTDNVMYRPRVRADWDGDGVEDDPHRSSTLQAWREGYRRHWNVIRALRPGVLVMGNSDGDLDEPEFRGQLGAAFLEALIGRHWSIESRLGWDAMMGRYRAAIANTTAPNIVGFGVYGDPKDFRLFRYAFASCLLDDGYFAFTDTRAGYSSVAWFDEYDVKLGRAVSSPPVKPWQNGVWRRDYERGVVLVNPSVISRLITLERGLRRFSGRQAERWNDGTPVTTLILPPKDGIVLVREMAK